MNILLSTLLVVLFASICASSTLLADSNYGASVWNNTIDLGLINAGGLVKIKLANIAIPYPITTSSPVLLIEAMHVVLINQTSQQPINRDAVIMSNLQVFTQGDLVLPIMTFDTSNFVNPNWFPSGYLLEARDPINLVINLDLLEDTEVSLVYYMNCIVPSTEPNYFPLSLYYSVAPKNSRFSTTGTGGFYTKTFMFNWKWADSAIMSIQGVASPGIQSLILADYNTNQVYCKSVGLYDQSGHLQSMAPCMSNTVLTFRQSQQFKLSALYDNSEALVSVQANMLFYYGLSNETFTATFN
ncbi:hypothetical protein DFA_04965 [Cavenderia fasciculata]|uniref:Uncharacterized protein n=1 Tax=Cavenderia fasciculata TaxID=261658 RepID=F4PMN8_CACFS|nr:uncharacterized protein DFA_04965 [Cavenderia fasciculata]EGG22835.1 hypothetical protein DFA_04965 [Cavenderia fasciculata]|eukprot:XP_004360686.1 hypothetical protein DFA_04965 [Cavenderia fasciculata]